MITLRRATVAVGATVGAAAGGYTLIYLARWEWHRALITAMFFLAAEVALAAGLVLRRLAQLEARLDAATAPSPDRPAPLLTSPVGADDAAPASVAAVTAKPATAASHHFAWLKDGLDGRLSVFLPVMVGAGVLASALAWAVESLARATARPESGTRLVRRLEPLAWPPGGLSGGPARPEPPRRRIAAAGWVRPVAVFAGLALVLFGVDSLADAIQTRPEKERSGIRTTFVLDIRGQGSNDAARVGQELWGVCRTTLRRSLPEPEVISLEGSRVAVAVQSDLGRSALARIRGCLQDASVDYVQAAVLAVQVVEPQD